MTNTLKNWVFTLEFLISYIPLMGIAMLMPFMFSARVLIYWIAFGIWDDICTSKESTEAILKCKMKEISGAKFSPSLYFLSQCLSLTLEWIATHTLSGLNTSSE